MAHTPIHPSIKRIALSDKSVTQEIMTNSKMIPIEMNDNAKNLRRLFAPLSIICFKISLRLECFPILRFIVMVCDVAKT